MHHTFFRRSFTRTALPCERGTSPRALMTTSQVTPMRALIWRATSSARLLREAVVGRRAGRDLDLHRHGVERAFARQHDLIVRRDARASRPAPPRPATDRH